MVKAWQHANRKLVWKVPHALLWAVAECQMRILAGIESALQMTDEVSPLVARRTEPRTGWVVLGFRWTGLQGRELSSWAQPLRHISPGRHAYRDEVFSSVAVPLETPPSAVHQFVYAATESLFEAFDGFQLSQAVVEDLTNRLFQRRL